MNWWEKFGNDHGERLVYIAFATIFGIGFIIAGVLAKIPELKGAGITILIQVGGIFISRMRSPKGNGAVEPTPLKPPTTEIGGGPNNV